MELILMISEVEIGKTYKSKSGFTFLVTNIAKHGQCCDVPMIVYISVSDTLDSKSGQVWVIEESIFIKRFFEND
jgi:hypothetical protein